MNLDRFSRGNEKSLQAEEEQKSYENKHFRGDKYLLKLIKGEWKIVLIEIDRQQTRTLSVLFVMPGDSVSSRFNEKFEGKKNTKRVSSIISKKVLS